MAKKISLHIIDSLKDILQHTRLEHANFSQIYTGQTFNYPTNEKEADEFVKQRVKLYNESWVISPLEDAINDLEQFNKDAELRK